MSLQQLRWAGLPESGNVGALARIRGAKRGAGRGSQAPPPLPQEEARVWGGEAENWGTFSAH